MRILLGRLLVILAVLVSGVGVLGTSNSWAVTNLITNPGFESSTGWTFWGASAYTSSSPHGGSRAAEDGLTSGTAYQDITSGFTVGQTYVISGWGQVSTQGEVGFIGVQARNSSGAVLYDAKSTFVSTSYYQNATTFVVPAGTTDLRAYVYKDDGPKAGYFYGDDLSLTASTGTQYYVDSATGSDSNAGTSSSSPWKTLSHASAHTYAAGDTLLLQGGETFSGSLTFGSSSGGTLANPVTVTSYGTGKATISSDSTAAGISATDSGGYHVYNVNLTGSGLADTYNGILFLNDSTSTRQQVIGIDNVDVSGYCDGVLLFGAKGYGFTPVTIMNVTSHDNEREGVSVAGFATGGTLSTTCGLAGGTNWYSQNIFANVYIGSVTTYNDHTWSGIYESNSAGAVIEHSVAHDIGADASAIKAGPVGIWSYGSTNITVQFNTVYNVHTAPLYTDGFHHDGEGFDISSNNENAIYQYNYAYGNGGPGILLDEYIEWTPPANNLTVRYNVFQDDCQVNEHCGEIYLYGPIKDANIFNNTFYTDRSGASDFLASGAVYYAPSGMVDVNVWNNIFEATGGDQLVHLTATTELPTGTWADAGTANFQENLYYPGSGGSFVISYKGTTYTSLTAFRAVPQEVNGTTNTGVQGDPLLVAPSTDGSAANLKVGSTSPAVNAGLNLSTLFSINPGAIDYFLTSTPVGTAYDIGAQEQ